MFSKETIAFFIGAILSLLLSYLQISVNTVQQIVILLLIILLVFLDRFYVSKIKASADPWFHLLLLFLSSLLVQLLILSTGGFFSPLLVLIHLYTLGISLLLNLRSSIVFLIFSLVILTASLRIDQKLANVFAQDPMSVILYLISFIIIIPLAQYLTRTYNLKGAVSKILGEHIRMGKILEESILASLSELVLITNQDLRILSVNDAMAKVTGVEPEDLAHHYLFDVLHLSDEKGKPADIASLQIDEAMEQRTTKIIENFYMYLYSAKPTRVILQIRPIADLKGEISQIAFVITSAQNDDNQFHSYLDQSRLRHKALAGELKKALETTSPGVLQEFQLYGKSEDDLLTALEIGDHPIKETPALHDVSKMAEQAIEAKKEFATSLGVNLQFDSPKTNQYLSVFVAPVFTKWFDLLLRKLLDIAILLSSGREPALVRLSLSTDNRDLYVSMISTAPVLGKDEGQNLFTQYYGDWAAKTNLSLGSGLEGFIAKTISDELKIPLKVKSENGNLTFELRIAKGPLH